MRKELRNIVNYKKEETVSTSSGYLSKKQFIKDAETYYPEEQKRQEMGKEILNLISLTSKTFVFMQSCPRWLPLV